MHRRALLLGLAALGGSFGCSAAPSAPALVAPRALPPLSIAPLHRLIPAGGLAWAIIVKPKELFEIAALREGISSIIPDQRLKLFETVTAIDLKKVETAIIASYGKSTLFLVDDVSNPLEAERRYRDRLTKEIVRSSFRDDAVMVRGLSARGEIRSLAALGPKLVGIETGADSHLKAVMLFAQGKLHRSKTLMQIPDLARLGERFGSAPILALAPGPFEGEWKQGLRGLLSVSSAAGGALRLTPVGSLQGTFAILGEWGPDAEKASVLLRSCWDDIANSGFGRLTGLSKPVADPLLTHSNEVVSLTVEADPLRFLSGLKAAVSGQVEEIMDL